jgi:signal transduction histidine kinase
MTPRIGFSLIAGFGALIILTAALGISQSRRAAAIQRDLISAQETYTSTESLLSETRVDLYRIGMNVRDYLLDRSGDSVQMRAELLKTRQQVLGNLEMLESRMALEHREPLKKLRDEVEEYFEWTSPALSWTPEEKAAYSGTYVRGVLLKRREAITSLASQLQNINSSNLRRARERLERSQQEYLQWLKRLTSIVVVLSLLIAALSVTWIMRLERQAERERRRAEQAERELRLLSQQLVRAQEEERRSLSRELHDQVGQQLTALRVEIANLARIPQSDRALFESQVREAKALAQQTMKTVRDLAMGLRPSMLDDLGLGPAIEWQAREFSRRSGVPSTVELEGEINGDLSESERTSLFRIVQEALTNITKHAKATEVRIRLTANHEGILLLVTDNGRGVPTADSPRRGLGLLGMEERAKELGGSFSLSSSPGEGTTIEVWLPRRIAA